MIVIGDSHMTPSRAALFIGTHFSEIIAKKYDFNLIPYCRGGMSNGGIAICLHTALTEHPHPDLILLGTTQHERFEWPFGTKGCRSSPSIRDLRYENHQSISHKLPLAGDDPRIISAAIRDIIDQKGKTWEKGYTSYGDPVTERLTALKMYFEFIYDPNLKFFLDQQLVYAMYHKLHRSKIPYIICRDPLDVVTKSMQDIIPKNRYCWDEIRSILSGSEIDNDPGYHSDPSKQIEIADLLITRLNLIL